MLLSVLAPYHVIKLYMSALVLVQSHSTITGAKYETQTGRAVNKSQQLPVSRLQSSLLKYFPTFLEVSICQGRFYKYYRHGGQVWQGCWSQCADMMVVVDVMVAMLTLVNINIICSLPCLCLPGLTDSGLTVLYKASSSLLATSRALARLEPLAASHCQPASSLELQQAGPTLQAETTQAS